MITLYRVTAVLDNGIAHTDGATERPVIELLFADWLEHPDTIYAGIFYLTNDDGWQSLNEYHRDYELSQAPPTHN